ncbi:hypothetical protein [Corynebacterium sp. A21]|uniref:hypothetical protein n=1 Tax=Corynebacterium sp. A21 TaxID=3457318 RepID=UPI003FCF994B
MILKTTVRAARQELGLPTDEQSMTEAWEEIQEVVATRIDQLHQMMQQEWQNQHPGEQIPYLMNVELGEKSRLRGEEEILEEWINAPVREEISLREQADEATA